MTSIWLSPDSRHSVSTELLSSASGMLEIFVGASLLSVWTAHFHLGCLESNRYKYPSAILNSTSVPRWLPKLQHSTISSPHPISRSLSGSTVSKIPLASRKSISLTWDSILRTRSLMIRREISKASSWLIWASRDRTLQTKMQITSTLMLQVQEEILVLSPELGILGRLWCQAQASPRTPHAANPLMLEPPPWLLPDPRGLLEKPGKPGTSSVTFPNL